MKQKKQPSQKSLKAQQDLKVEYDLLVHQLGERTLQLDLVFDEIKALKEKIRPLMAKFAELEAK